MKHNLKREAGQSIVIITLVLVAFVALAAIVVDAGNSYVQRRKVQNAADAAAMAGSVAYAQKQSNGGIADTIENYLRVNGVDPVGVHAYFVVTDANGQEHILNGAGDKSLIPRQWVQDLRPPDKMPYQGVDMTVTGIYVDANKQFDTFFARAFGILQVKVLGDATGHVKGGICSATGVFPVAIDVKKLFPIDPKTGLPTIHYEQTDPTYEYALLEDAHNAPGNIGYLKWPTDPNGNAVDLAKNMNDPSRSGKVEISSATNPGISGSSGTSNSNDVRSAWQARLGGAPIILPVFDSVSGQGSNVIYHIVGFASFRVTGTSLTGNPKKVMGKFQEWVDPQARGGCADFGVSSVTQNPPPPDLKRTLAGSVTFQPVVPNKQPSTTKLSADVVFVLDTSGSMGNGFGADNTPKINAAITSMNSFVDKLNAGNAAGFQHQAGFVRFPQNYSNGNFTNSQDCSDDWNWAVQAQTYSSMTARTPLGSSFSQVKSAISNSNNPNGGTPTGLGLIAGREIVLGAGHKAGNVPVIILATDGMPNVMSGNQRTTGWIGSLLNSNVALGKNPDGSNTYPNCNKQAALDAYAAANDVKNAGGIIFVIGTGGDVDPWVLKSMATPNANGKVYYFAAGDSAALNAAYDSIAQTLSDLAGTCSVQQKLPQRASGAKLTIKNVSTGAVLPAVTTLANGEFVVPNVAPGTYEITSAVYNDSATGLPYDTFTDAPGGKDVPNPIIKVGDVADTYRTDTFIRTKVDPCK